MDFASDVWYTLARRFRNGLREPIWIFFSLAQPLIWLLLFTQLFKNLALMPGFPTSEYLLFFAPGLIVMMAVFSSAYTGFDMLQDIQFGVVDKMLITPANRYAMVIGNILNALASMTIQILIIFAMVYFTCLLRSVLRPDYRHPQPDGAGGHRQPALVAINVPFQRHDALRDGARLGADGHDVQPGQLRRGGGETAVHQRL